MLVAIFFSFFHNILKAFLQESLTLSQTSFFFFVTAIQVFRKHCGEKEKLLITNNFSFSHSVFYPLGELPAIFIQFEIVFCKVFQFGRSLKFIVWERFKETRDHFDNGWRNANYTLYSPSLTLNHRKPRGSCSNSSDGMSY